MGCRRGEFDLIAGLFAPLSKGAPGAFNLTDDAAHLVLDPDSELVVTADTSIGGVHFRLDDPPNLIARKALRVNLSDLAAKGARPLGFLQALMLNPGINDDYLQSYAEGLAEDVQKFDVPLLGGDTTSGPGPLAITITALGAVPRGQTILRRGARPGDLICVTGTIGDGALGLACLSGVADDPTGRDFLVDRYRTPQPRLAVGIALRGRASACLDISDGLVADIEHLCTASGVAGIIERARIPLSDAGRRIVTQAPEHWAAILGGGDDYELAFTLPQAEAAAVREVASISGTAVTVVGRIVEPDYAKVGCVTVVDEEGGPVDVPLSGYRHR